MILRSNSSIGSSIPRGLSLPRTLASHIEQVSNVKCFEIVVKLTLLPAPSEAFKLPSRLDAHIIRSPTWRREVVTRTPGVNETWPILVMFHSKVACLIGGQ